MSDRYIQLLQQFPPRTINNEWSEIDKDLSTEGLLRGAPAPRSQFGGQI